MVSGVRGRSVLVVEDSIVRGTNIHRERALLEEVGLSDGYHALYTPPIGIIGDDGVPRGCRFGIDMPPNDTFFARDRSHGADARSGGSAGGLPHQGRMLKVYDRLGIAPENLCTYCIGGPYPYAKAGFPDTAQEPSPWSARPRRSAEIRLGPVTAARHLPQDDRHRATAGNSTPAQTCAGR